MTLLDTLTRYATDYQARRRRFRSYQEITSLPREIQKDIGWPDSYAEHEARLAERSRR